jgi:hypothetical protein
MYIPRNWEFGSALAKLRDFGGGFRTIGTPLALIIKLRLDVLWHDD